MSKYGFGVDVGGTTVKIGLFTDDVKLDEKWEIDTDTSDNGVNILPDIAKAVKDKLSERNIDKADVVGIGIGVPGAVTADGVVHRAVNLGWGEVHLEKELSELSGFPVVAGNDANVAALGEAWVGAGKDYSSVCAVTLGTGIGGGLIVNRKIVVGAHGAGAEIGHMVINPDEKEQCSCGLHGCSEQYGSATGVVRLAKRHLASSDKESRLRGYLEADHLSAKQVFDAARDGDELAIEIVDDVTDKLGLTLAHIAAVADPEAFLIGGGVSRAGDVLLKPLRESFKRQAFHACRSAEIITATLGNDAGMYGSAKLIFDKTN